MMVGFGAVAAGVISSDVKLGETLLLNTVFLQPRLFCNHPQHIASEPEAL